jgi:hypothetical protein
MWTLRDDLATFQSGGGVQGGDEGSHLPVPGGRLREMQNSTPVGEIVTVVISGKSETPRAYGCPTVWTGRALSVRGMLWFMLLLLFWLWLADSEGPLAGVPVGEIT